MRKSLPVIVLSISAVLSGFAFVDNSAAASTDVVHVTSQVASQLTVAMPIVRLNFSSAVNAGSLPTLRTRPTLTTKWQQIGPNEVQAVAVSTPQAALSYAITMPTSLRCATSCVVLRSRTVTTQVNVNVAWEDQLLAQLGYLPVTFTSRSTSASPSQEVAGSYTWAYPQLPGLLRSLWSVGSDNVVLQGALMSFQLDNNLPTTGVMNPATWNTLVQAANNGTADPKPYVYVSVSMHAPETLTLYQNGVPIFHTLVNTGIPQAPTSVGTYPVYLRYTSQTMRGTNPDGTTYDDAGIPWVSYFHGGEALHGFIRSSYGFPQSLGCVEMPFVSAGTVFPHTPIGTLVTVRA